MSFRRERNNAMALVHARNAVLRALRELEIARFGFESLGCSHHGDFARAATDVEVLAERLHRSARGMARVHG